MTSPDNAGMTKLKELGRGKAGSIGATSILGGALMGGLNLLYSDSDNLELKNQLAMVIPFVAVSLTETGRYFWALFSVDPQKYVLRKSINKKIKLIKSALKEKGIAEERKKQLEQDLYSAQDALHATYDEL